VPAGRPGAWLDKLAKVEYYGGMKVKTSITLTEDLLNAIDQLPDEYHNRSSFLEAAAWAFISQLRRDEQATRDIEIINRCADRLNAEVMDALAYQVSV